MQNASDIQQQLLEPFDVTEVKFRPTNVKGNRAMALAYIDARLVMDRLDDVVGWDNWQDEYTLLKDDGTSVLCTLRVRINGEWITKTDIGGISEQPDEGDRNKAAISDALKRAAVKFGIGRYLYRLPTTWADYDAQKRQFVAPPKLPAWAYPTKKPIATGGQPAEPKPATPTQPAANGNGPKPPANGAELYQRLRKAQNDLVNQGLCADGEILGHVDNFADERGYPQEVMDWTAEQVGAAGTAAKFKIEEIKQRQPQQPLKH